MTPPRLRAALAVWRSRKNRTGGGWAYRAYLLVMVVAIAVTPVVRTLWLWATAPGSVVLLSTPQAPEVVSLLVALAWAAALFVGRLRGPALLPPFLLHVFAASSMDRSATLRWPVMRAAAVSGLAALASAGFVGAALLEAGAASAMGVLAFLLAGLATGVIASLCALVGQAFPRAASLAGIGILAGALLARALSLPLASIPWGWVGGVYPTAGHEPPELTLLLGGLSVLAASLSICAPTMLRTMNFDRLSEQAEQWDSTVAFSSTLEFSLTAAVYRERPRIGRHIRAIRSFRRLPLVFVVRDAIGLFRTPGRLVAATAATVIAGLMLTCAFGSPAYAAYMAAGAALLLYAATGVFGQGLRHAANAAADYPLYGISDRALIAYHALVPLCCTVSLAIIAVTVGVSVGGATLVTPLFQATGLTVLVLLIRLNECLKGPLPTRLLAPIESPAGDLSIIAQLAWALGEPLMALLAGAAVALMPVSLAPLIVMASWVLVVSTLRWRRRRTPL